MIYFRKFKSTLNKHMVTEFILLHAKEEDLTLVGLVPGSSQDTFYIYSLPFRSFDKHQFQSDSKLIFFLDISNLEEETILEVSSSLNKISNHDIYVCIILNKDFLTHSEQYTEMKYENIDRFQEHIPNVDVYVSFKYAFKKDDKSKFIDLLSLWNKAFKFCKQGNLDFGRYSLSNSNLQGSDRFNRLLSISTVSSNNDSSISKGIFSKSHSTLINSSSENTPVRTPIQQKESIANSIRWTNKYLEVSPSARAYVKYMTQNYKKTQGI